MASSVPFRKKLLIIDDDLSVHDFVAYALRAQDIDIACCTTANEAFQTIEQCLFDVILLDLGLPDMHGLELLTRLRQIDISSRVIVITADQTAASVLRAIRENTYDYIRKPLTADGVADAVSRALVANTEPAIEVLSAKQEWLELSIPCTRNCAERIERFVRQLDADLGLELIEPVAQAFRELLMNAVEWGGGLDPSRRVRISCLRTARMLLYRIADPGPGFRFEGLMHSAIANPGGALASGVVREEKGLRPGGLGLLMVQAFADDVIYNERQNEVVLLKYLA